jgi:hypothetical protein
MDDEYGYGVRDDQYQKGWDDGFDDRARDDCK